MITARTFKMLLVSLLLGLGLVAWSFGRRDVCAAHLAGLPGPSTQVVERGRSAVEVPCDQWFPRQPIAVQAGSIVVGSLGLALLFSFAIDLVTWRRPRRGYDR